MGITNGNFNLAFELAKRALLSLHGDRWLIYFGTLILFLLFYLYYLKLWNKNFKLTWVCWFGLIGAAVISFGLLILAKTLLVDDWGIRLTSAGAATGDIQISLKWNNYNDLDLRCLDPNGEEIYFGHRNSSSGGLLDVDRNVTKMDTRVPVENIFWAKGFAPDGEYRISVQHYTNHGDPDPTAFEIRVVVGVKRAVISSLILSGNTKLVGSFKLLKGKMVNLTKSEYDPVRSSSSPVEIGLGGAALIAQVKALVLFISFQMVTLTVLGRAAYKALECTV